MPSRTRKVATMTAAVVFVGVVLSGCTATAEPNPATATDQPPASDAAAPTPTTEPPQQSEVAIDSRAAEYDAAIAAWPEALPPGYSWPAWSDLPHIDPLGNGQLGQADNASGIYRCILIDAAWHAYFEDNDAVASKDYATRADAYAIPDNLSTRPVTTDGVILDQELASANGICTGISGDLPVAND